MEGSTVSRTGFLCTDEGVHPSVFFPEILKKETIDKAKGYCNKCPNRLPCLEKAISNREQHGIWGGLTEQERRKYSLKAALKAGRDYASRHNTLHEPQHPECEDPSSQLYIPNVQIHIQLALSPVVEAPLLSPIIVQVF